MSLAFIAMRTAGFSGADLANLMNESAILAGRRGKDRINPSRPGSWSDMVHTI